MTRAASAPTVIQSQGPSRGLECLMTILSSRPSKPRRGVPVPFETSGEQIERATVEIDDDAYRATMPGRPHPAHRHRRCVERDDGPTANQESTWRWPGRCGVRLRVLYDQEQVETDRDGNESQQENTGDETFEIEVSINRARISRDVVFAIEGHLMFLLLTLLPVETSWRNMGFPGTRENMSRTPSKCTVGAMNERNRPCRK
jgi:hypothetical protein